MVKINYDRYHMVLKTVNDDNDLTGLIVLELVDMHSLWPIGIDMYWTYFRKLQCARLSILYGWQPDEMQDLSRRPRPVQNGRMW